MKSACVTILLGLAAAEGPQSSVVFPPPRPSTPSPGPQPTPRPTPVNPSTINCDTVDSCSPTSFCEKVSNKACTFPEPTIDMNAEIKSLGCRKCTQASTSEHPICSSKSLKATIVQPSAVQAAFCNDEFLVIHTIGQPNHATNLAGVPHPPGGGDGPYDSSCVTRSFIKQSQTFKIPLNYSLLADGMSNTVEGKLPTEDLPMSGATGVMTNGVPIYPNEDNRGETIQDACEADRCMAHVGKGADYHYHGDPFGTTCMYSEANYTGTHPMIVGFGVDGPPIYGRYTSKTQDGVDVPLDACGGHAHDPFSYHYHPNVVTATNSESGKTYQAAVISPYNCWKGDISKISNFWMDNTQWRAYVDNGGATENPTAPTQINYDNTKTNPPNDPTKRSDAEEITPCCSSTEYFTAAGVTLPVDDVTITV